MKKIFFLVGLFFLLLNTQAAEYAVDKSHTMIGFTATHLVITDVDGNFGDYNIALDFDENSKEVQSIQATIQTQSINTNNSKRDDHLRSSDFFDADFFPEITFQSKEITKNGDKYQIKGMMTIKDVTQEVIFEGRLRGIKTHHGKIKAGFVFSTKINRQDFNIKFKALNKAGDLVVSDEILINIKSQFVKK